MSAHKCQSVTPPIVCDPPDCSNLGALEESAATRLNALKRCHTISLLRAQPARLPSAHHLAIRGKRASVRNELDRVTHALSLIVYWAVWYTGLDSLIVYWAVWYTGLDSLIVYWAVWYTGLDSLILYWAVWYTGLDSLIAYWAVWYTGLGLFPIA